MMKIFQEDRNKELGLARAFLRKTPILLLDEPTSRIDSLNEAALLESLKQIKDEKLDYYC